MLHVSYNKVWTIFNLLIICDSLENRHLALDVGSDVGEWRGERVAHASLRRNVDDVREAMPLKDVLQELFIAETLVVHHCTKFVQLIRSILFMEREWRHLSVAMTIMTTWGSGTHDFEANVVVVVEVVDNDDTSGVGSQQLDSRVEADEASATRHQV